MKYSSYNNRPIPECSSSLSNVGSIVINRTAFIDKTLIHKGEAKKSTQKQRVIHNGRLQITQHVRLILLFTNLTVHIKASGHSSRKFPINVAVGVTISQRVLKIPGNNGANGN